MIRAALSRPEARHELQPELAIERRPIARARPVRVEGRRGDHVSPNRPQLRAARDWRLAEAESRVATLGGATVAAPLGAAPPGGPSNSAGVFTQCHDLKGRLVIGRSSAPRRRDDRLYARELHQDRLTRVLLAPSEPDFINRFEAAHDAFGCRRDLAQALRAARRLRRQHHAQAHPLTVVLRRLLRQRFANRHHDEIGRLALLEVAQPASPCPKSNAASKTCR